MDILRTSGGIRFEQIDHKLANALTKCIESGGDAAKEVAYRLRSLKLERGKVNDLVLGREILALILTGFTTANHDRMMFSAANLYSLKYPGDHSLDKFWNMWLEIQNNIAPEDKQSDRTLRDCLWKKIQYSKLMEFDMKKYDAANEGDEVKTLKWLEGRIAHCIKDGKPKRGHYEDLHKASGGNERVRAAASNSPPPPVGEVRGTRDQVAAPMMSMTQNGPGLTA